MNIQIADRLIQLRKNNGLSQEALAEKLGISRQAISKWERAEASPDTDNLIALAEIYGMTLDQLLDTSNDAYVIGEKEEEKPEKTKKEKAPLLPIQKTGKKLFAAFPIVTLAVVAAYVIGGFAVGTAWWANLWLLFFIIPIFATVAAACFAGRTKRIFYLLMTFPVALTAVVIFLAAGLFLDAWAVAWIVYLAIPVYAYAAFLMTKNK